MRVINLVDNRPLASNFQQVEKIGETKAANIIRINAGAGSDADNINTHHRGFGIWRGFEYSINDVVKPLDMPACKLSFAVHTEHCSLLGCEGTGWWRKKIGGDAQKEGGYMRKHVPTFVRKTVIIPEGEG